MRIHPFILVGLILSHILAAAAAHAGDWPRFRGPNGSGTLWIEAQSPDGGMTARGIANRLWGFHIGRGIVRAMPAVMVAIATVGTVAMLWVGGSLLVHGMAHFHFEWRRHSDLVGSG